MMLPPTRNHRQLAEWINANRPELRATVLESYSNTDRKLTGTRLIVPGKGRRGLRLAVMTRDRWLTKLFEHDMSETYRSHGEARKWVQQWCDNRINISGPQWGTREEFITYMRRQ